MKKNKMLKIILKHKILPLIQTFLIEDSRCAERGINKLFCPVETHMRPISKLFYDYFTLCKVMNELILFVLL